MSLRKHLEPDDVRDLAERISTMNARIQQFKIDLIRDARQAMQVAQGKSVAGKLSAEEILEVENFGAGVNAVVEAIDKAKWPR